MINFQSISNDQFSKIYTEFTKYLKKNNFIFFRVEPSFVNLKSKILNHKSSDVNPRATIILDLQKTEDELLAAMHEKTRYNIRLASKKDLKIVRLKDLNVLMSLMKKTGERDKFRLHSENHYKQVLSSPSVCQLSVEIETTDYGLQTTAVNGGDSVVRSPSAVDHPSIATAVFVGFGDTFTYLFGASDYEYRNLMAPYLLQWEGIKLGKRLGYKFYDFFGIAPPKAEIRNPNNEIRNDNSYSYDLKHQYAGVTRFKMGFGGMVKESPGTFDLVVSPIKYKIYKIARLARRLVNI